jgi:uncharacterized membrane protein YbhN (UPF0104 family)
MKYITNLISKITQRLIEKPKGPKNIKPKRSKKIKRMILLVASVLLSIGVYYSFSQNPDLIRRVDKDWLLVLALVGVPVTIVLNALEFYISARMIDAKVAFLKSIEVTVIGSAANMLPFPGSTMVRVAALKMSGANFKNSALVTLLIAFVWIGVSFIFSGSVLVFYPNNYLGFIFSAVGGGTLIFTMLFIHMMKIKWRYYLKLLLTKVSLVLVDAARILVCFWALDSMIDFSQASVFVISGVVGSAASIVPAGLGVREFVSAGVAPLVGISMSMGLLSATLNRLVGLVVLVPLAFLLTLFTSQKKEYQEEINEK